MFFDPFAGDGIAQARSTGVGCHCHEPAML
jgi:hypothetical protein